MSQFGPAYFKLSPELISVLDKEGNFIEINPAWPKTLGWEIQDFLQLSYIHFVHPDDKERSEIELKKLFTTPGHTTIGFENRWKHKNGGWRWLQWSASYIAEDQQIFCITRDITESKRESLLFAETQEVSLIGSWEIDLTTNELFWSKMTHQIHETDAGTYHPVLEDGLKYFPVESRAYIETHVNKLITYGESYDLELPFITAKGRQTWVRCVAKAIIQNEVVQRVFGTIEDISSKKIQKSKVELIFESGNFGTWDWDLETNNVYFNERFCSMIGLDYKSVKHELKTWDENTHPEDKIVTYKDIKDYLEGRTPYYRNIHRMKHVDGHWVWILDQGKIVEYRNGKPIRFSGTHTDISYLKQLEEEKTILNDRFKLTLAAIKFGVWELDLEKNVLVWDESMYELFGINKSDFSGNVEAWASTLHPEDKEYAIAQLQAAIQNESDLDLSFRVITNKQETRYIAAKGHVEKDANGKSVRVIGINWDITKEVQQAKIFETIVNNIPILITFYNQKGEVEWINSHWTETLGWTIDDLKHFTTTPRIFLTPEDHEDAAAFMKEAPDEWREYSLLRKDGNVAYTTWTNVLLPDGKCIGIGQDIGEKRMQEELIRHQQAKMISSAKLSSLGEMASGIAHEINNPLAIIKGKAYQILKRLESKDINVEYIAKEITKIEQNSLRITKIIKGLRTFSRNGDNDPYQNVSFKSVLDDVLELCFERFKHQGVDLKIAGDINSVIYCQETQLAQVLLNLLNNAYDAVVFTNSPWVEIMVENTEVATTIYVTDSGSGISDEVAAKIMQPFFTTKDVGSGTGLGLSISKGIIEMHGGTLFLDRNCSNTRFIIQLPRNNSYLKERDSSKGCLNLLFFIYAFI